MMRKVILGISFMLTGILAACGSTEPEIETEPVQTETVSASVIETQESNEKVAETNVSEEEYKELCEVFDYKEYFRNDQKYTGEKIQADIQIAQVIKGDCRGYDSSGNEYYIIDMRSEDNKFRLIEDDYITVYGEYAGVGEITRAIGDYDEEVFCINAKYIVLHDEDNSFVSDNGYGQVESGDLPDDGESMEYIFPDSNSRLLTEADISRRSAEELRIGKNEIYAHHGRIFTSEDLKEYFNSKSWYVGSISPDQFSESVLIK